MKSKYCFEYSPEIETLLDNAVKSIRAEIESGEEAENIKFIVLGGGYGRGEGGVRIEGGKPPRIYNDLDFFVIAKDSADPRKIDSFFKKISKEWTEKLGVDVDFGPAATATYIQKRLHMLMWREMVLAGNVIFGDSESFKKTFALNADAPLPQCEIFKLLFNRYYGLFLASLKLSAKELNESERDFVARNINKAVLAAGDALVFDSLEFKFSSADKLEALKSLDCPPAAQDIAKAYEDALKFKRNPDCSADAKILSERLKSAKRLCVGVLDFMFSRKTAKETPWQKLKNLRKNLKSAKYFAKLPVPRPLFGSPAISMLRALKKFLSEETIPDKAQIEAVKNIWKTIN